MNFVNYIKKYSDETFEKMPFNDIDALVLAQMSYINFHLDLKRNTFKKMKNFVVENPKEFFFGSFDAMNNKKLLALLQKSKRFGDVKIGHCASYDDPETKTQFFALTCILPNGDAYVSFRGTDITINGWKEDLLIAYVDKIPGAELAYDYLLKESEHFTGRFYLGGHSKGGNLAIFAALMSNKKLREKLINAYSFDGPGTGVNFSNFRNPDEVLPKVKKFVTNNDIVGVVYNRIENVKIVVSTGVLLGGHDLFRWKVNVKEKDFVYSKDRSFFSKSHEEALTKWLVSVSQEDKQLAVNILSDLLGESENVFDLLKNALKVILTGKKTWDGYSIEQKARASEIFKKLASFYASAYTPKAIASQKRKAKAAS